MTAPTSYPLAWPPGRPRKRSPDCGRPFRADGKWITMAAALARLETEASRLGAGYPLLSSNMALRLDGQIRAGQSRPADAGVCLYFQRAGASFALACDAYDDVAQNIAALAAHIEAVRKIERYGVATANETLAAFRALPAPEPVADQWWNILGLGRPNALDGLPPAIAIAAVEKAFRLKAAFAHPDKGGSDAAMASLGAAKDAALASIAP